MKRVVQEAGLKGQFNPVGDLNVTFFPCTKIVSMVYFGGTTGNGQDQWPSLYELRRGRESREKRGRLMTRPTLDQTEGIWIGRTSNQGYHYVQDVFPGDTLRERWHRENCRVLIARGHLQAERRDNLAVSQKEWKQEQRYKQVHI